MHKTLVISLGGSIISPGEVDTGFLRDFYALVKEHLAESEERRLIIVTGGGAPARSYQEAYRAVTEDPQPEAQDWIGIAATRLNGQLVKAIFGRLCTEEVATNPETVSGFSGRILVAAGWKPGFSTDYDAVILAERFGAEKILNLSNVAKVYTADPKKDPEAKPLDTISWKDFRVLVGDSWVPGSNLPFDPVAARRASELGLTVIMAGGRDIPNLRSLLKEKAFIGTSIGPE